MSGCIWWKASLIVLCSACSLIACGSDDGGSGGSAASVDLAVCDQYCGRATKVCSVTLDGCRSGCKAQLEGTCSAQFRPLYECWANADTLVCDEFKVASSEACRGLSEDAGNCVLGNK